MIQLDRHKRSLNKGKTLRSSISLVDSSHWSSSFKAVPQKELFKSNCKKPRTRRTVTIWNLPDSIFIHILKGFHIRDFFAFRSAHPTFRDIIDNNKILWTHLSFFESWPSEKNLHHFIRASQMDNFEATIKLAVAYLYKEGISQEDGSVGGQKAAQYLSQAEALTPNILPFFWVFIRPPWSPDGECCKSQAFRCIKSLVDTTNDRDLAFGVALTLKLQRLSTSSDVRDEEEKYFNLAISQESAAARFFSILDKVPDECDKAQELEKIRMFRQIASKDVLEARLNLVKCYIQGQYGGISQSMAQDYVRDFFQSSKPSGIHKTFCSGHTSDMSRYILVDWLVEVVGMKDFSAHTLYLAVSMFDQYLQTRRVQRCYVQLLGVAAMVLSSRFLGFDILTIREAAWLTDNSYSYHDVVRMMGELVAALRGNIRVPTIQDYVKVLVSVSNESGYSAMLVEYIAMLSLLQAEMGQYSPAEVASSCLLLSRLLMNHADPWPLMLQEWTGFTQDYLSLCTFHIHKKCLQEGSDVDYRDTKLKAVKMRYADPNRYAVSSIDVIGHKELCRRLGVTRLVTHGKNTKAFRFRNTDELIMSPRRVSNQEQFGFWSQDDDIVDRQLAATPPVEQLSAWEEGVSGYDGDLEEDLEDSFSDHSDLLYELNEDSDLDRSNLADSTNDSSKYWDSETSMMEEENSSLDSAHLSVQGKQCCRSSITGRIACLSSMCRSRNNLTCPSTSTSPTSCICNCSCADFASLDDSPNNTLYSSASSSSLSLSSAESTPLHGIAQNVRLCLPSGNIRVIAKSSRRGKGSAFKVPSNMNCESKDLVTDRASCENLSSDNQWNDRESQCLSSLSECVHSMAKKCIDLTCDLGLTVEASPTVVSFHLQSKESGSVFTPNASTRFSLKGSSILHHVNPSILLSSKGSSSLLSNTVPDFSMCQETCSTSQYSFYNNPSLYPSFAISSFPVIPGRHLHEDQDNLCCTNNIVSAVSDGSSSEGGHNSVTTKCQPSETEVSLDFESKDEGQVPGSTGQCAKKVKFNASASYSVSDSLTSSKCLDESSQETSTKRKRKCSYKS